jgi:hypothetical protein
MTDPCSRGSHPGLPAKEPVSSVAMDLSAAAGENLRSTAKEFETRVSQSQQGYYFYYFQ